jgi:hypothetical protein
MLSQHKQKHSGNWAMPTAARTIALDAFTQVLSLQPAEHREKVDSFSFLLLATASSAHVLTMLVSHPCFARQEHVVLSVNLINVSCCSASCVGSTSFLCCVLLEPCMFAVLVCGFCRGPSCCDAHPALCFVPLC